jgi:hypothetical protein
MENVSAEMVVFGLTVIGALLACLAMCFIPYQED